MKTTARRLVAPTLIVMAMWLGVQWLQDSSSARLGKELSAQAMPGDIVMLSSVTCVVCAESRAWLVEHEVPFTECFIERDAACADRFNALQSPGTPTLLVRGQRQIGFSAERVAQALRPAG